MANLVAFLLFSTVFAAISQESDQDWKRDLPAETIDRIEQALKEPGSPELGRQLYEQDSRVTCKACHYLVGRESNKIGPNLYGIGDKYDRLNLMLEIENPSAKIHPGFETVAIETRTGEIHSGIIDLISPAEIVFKDGSGKRQRLPKEAVVKISYRRESIMPEGLTAGLTKNEYTNLIAYLASQKITGEEAYIGRDKPIPIQNPKNPASLEPILDNTLHFSGLVWRTQHPILPHHSILIEHKSGIAWLVNEEPGKNEQRPFLQLDQPENLSSDGFVCLVFHPQFATNRLYYTKVVREDKNGPFAIIEERQARDSLDADSGRAPRLLLRLNQPASNHNGGCLAFGPDGYFYTAFGDGGPQRDPNGHSQNPSTLIGSMIRIDVNHRDDGLPYAIPDDNPFAEQNPTSTIRRETWATGFREPWRFSFDSLTGEIWVGDVGQTTFEEVSLVEKGDNHGWNVREAFRPFSEQYQRSDEHYKDPVFAYSRALGTSITGGHVYRGNPESPLYGAYIFGEFESRFIWAIQRDLTTKSVSHVWNIATSPQRIAAFSVDTKGNLFVVGYQGQLYRLNLDGMTL